MKRLLSLFLCALTALTVSFAGFCEGSGYISVKAVKNSENTYLVYLNAAEGKSICGGSMTLSFNEGAFSLENCYISDEVSAQINPNYKNGAGLIRVSFSSAKPIGRGAGFICLEFKMSESSDEADFKITEYRLYNEKAQCIDEGKANIPKADIIDASSPEASALPDVVNAEGYIKKTAQEIVSEAASSEKPDSTAVSGDKAEQPDKQTEADKKGIVISVILVLVVLGAVIAVVLTVKKRKQKSA